jgi:hypothetical protein
MQMPFNKHLVLKYHLYSGIRKQLHSVGVEHLARNPNHPQTLVHCCRLHVTGAAVLAPEK